MSRCTTLSARRSASRSVLLAAALAMLDGVAPAQGEFVNFETPQVHPIEVFAADGFELLAVCNTPDNSLEIYDTDGDRFLQRLPAGLGPVTVRFNVEQKRLYVANFDGDTLSILRVEPARDRMPPRVVLERTVLVNDQPADIAFGPGGTPMYVTSSGRAALGIHDPLTGIALPNAWELPLMNPAGTAAMKSPRAILTFGSTIAILNFRGGNTPAYDFDLLVSDSAPFVFAAHGGLGSTNAAMARASDGRLFVIGTLARNDVKGNTPLSALPGFVESRLWVLDDPTVATPMVRRRDLNVDHNGTPVARTLARSQPTDIALLENDAGRVEKIYVTAFHSDRIAVIDPTSGADPATWRITGIDLPLLGLGNYSVVGPRGLALRPAATSRPARLYVANRLDNSVSVIDTVTDQEIARWRLQHDPTPDVIRIGRKHLYDARISGGGQVSCASCHVDGTTDSLSWHLGTVLPNVPPTQFGAPVPVPLIDGTSSALLNPAEAPFLASLTGLPEATFTSFPLDKEPKVTQTLQGLVNYVANPQAQDVFTNEPYHWRGDKPAFADFNEAFVNLMAAPNLGTPTDPKGLLDPDMQAYVSMIETIVYPPNYEQQLDRRYSGDLGDPNDESTGSGALRGMKLFHTRRMDFATSPDAVGALFAGRSCVGCHALPEGSNNLISMIDPISGFQPLESAAMRGLVTREAELPGSKAAGSTVRTAALGLLNHGVALSIDDFFISFFAGFFQGTEMSDLVRFGREFDWGIAPIVGKGITVTTATKNDPGIGGAIGLGEHQVEQANAGLAVYLRAGGVEHGYWYDVTIGRYREVGSAGVATRAQLLTKLADADDILVLQAVPTGSERRFAALDGRAAPLAAGRPTSITLEPMRASTAWRDVPQLTRNWQRTLDPLNTQDFFWQPLLGSEPIPPQFIDQYAPQPHSLRTLRIFQQALIAQVPQYGLTYMRHDPSRRLRVAGDGILLGATLCLRIPMDTTPPPYNGSELTKDIELPIFPTSETNAAGRRIWETAAELDNLQTYVLMLGGLNAPGVRDTIEQVMTTEPPPPGVFDARRWNLHEVAVKNPDGQRSVPVWQPVRVVPITTRRVGTKGAPGH